MTSDQSNGAAAPESAPAAPQPRSLDTRRDFVQRLAKTAALPVVLPLMLSMSTAALA